MNPVQLHNLPIQKLSQPSFSSEKSPADVHSTFSNMLGDAINKVNTSQVKSDEMITKFINGDTTDLHNVMIAVEKSGIILQTAVEIRNKAIEAYQEIMRMQV